MEEEILNEMSTNILKWYEFKKNSNILYVGKNNNIVKYLNTKSNKVENVDELQDEKTINFNYIIIDKVEKNENIVEKLNNYINKDTIILFIVDNKYGISQFMSYNYEKQISPLEEDKKYANIIQLEAELEKSKFNFNKYLVFPDAKKVDMVVNSKYDISVDKLDKYFCNYSQDKVVVANEVQLMKNILKYDKELFEKLANSYLIEASLEEIQNDIKYVSFNNYRKDRYRLITKIKEDVVEKVPDGIESMKHINSIGKNLEQLKDYNFEILDKYENNKLFSELVKDKDTLDIELAIHSSDKNYIISILEKIREELLRHSKSYDEVKTKIDKKIKEKFNEEELQKMNFMEYAFFDMLPKNCFYIEDRFYFFDQEWMAKYLPVEFIIYRALINCYDLVRKIDINEFLTELGIAEYKNVFDDIDVYIRKEIIDEERFKICIQQHPKMYEVIYENKVLRQEANNLNTVIDDYKNNNIKQDEYIKKLEAENLKFKNKKLWKFKF